MKYKFLGSSPDGPRVIKFMGMYDFTVDGPAVEVTNPEVLDKLKTHKFFELVEDGIKADVIEAEFTEKPDVLPTPKKRGRPAKAK